MNADELFLTAIDTAADRLNVYRGTVISSAEKELKKSLTEGEEEALMFGFMQGATLAFFERIQLRKEPDHKYN